MQKKQKSKKLEVIVKGIELTKKNKIKIILSSSYGEYDIILSNKKAKRFWPGQKYIGNFELYSSTDFFMTPNGPKKEDVATVSYILSTLENKKGEIIYKK